MLKYPSPTNHPRHSAKIVNSWLADSVVKQLIKLAKSDSELELNRTIVASSEIENWCEEANDTFGIEGNPHGVNEIITNETSWGLVENYRKRLIIVEQNI